MFSWTSGRNNSFVRCHSSFKNSLIPAKTEAINPCFPALLTLFLTSFDCRWCIGPLAVSIHLFRIQVFVWHLKQFTHISIWHWKVIRPEPWLIVFRFDLRGSDWINDVLTGIHWSGRKELQVCRGIKAIIWGYDLSKMLLFPWRIFYFALQHLNQCLIRGPRGGTQNNPFGNVVRRSRSDTWGNERKTKKEMKIAFHLKGYDILRGRTGRLQRSLVHLSVIAAYRSDQRNSTLIFKYNIKSRQSLEWTRDYQTK